jgi:hypothetical protein
MAEGCGSRPPLSIPLSDRYSRRTALPLSATILALLLGGVAPAQHDTFAFGRTGGNIRPYTVAISARGVVTATGPVRLAHPGRRVAAATLRQLEQIVKTTRFFSFPTLTLCPGSLPDFASSFVAVKSGTRHRRVVVRGTCSPRFASLYQALTAAAGVR